MKRFLCLVMAAVLLCVALSGCNKDGKRQEEIESHLKKGEYQEAYKVAETSKEKEAIIAENFLAYVCYDIATNVDTDMKLVSGNFGQAKAKTSDAYTPNDSVFTIDNFEKLAEYVSLMTGEDALGDYHYGAFKVTVGGGTSYCLASVDIHTNAVALLYVWDTVEQTSADGNVVALYKFIARYVMKNGTAIEQAAADRINERYLTGTPEEVEFTFDLG